MIYSIYPSKDATLYQDILDLNSGLDEILELRAIPEKKMVEGYTEEDDSGKSISRILLQYDLSSISSSIVSGQISASAKFFLKLKTATASEINTSYGLEAFPVSHSWDMGTGRKNDVPHQTSGVSWDFKTSGSYWVSSGSSNGGTWYTQYSASQNFSYMDETDTNIDVTTIVQQWLSNTIPNNGLIVKFSGSAESDTLQYGSINFFSVDTHTVYPPELSVQWDDSSFSTGSLTVLDTEDCVIYMKNLRSHYSENEKAKIRLYGRSKYMPKTYTTSSRYSATNYMPQTTYYSIKDANTDEVVIPFDTNYTKVSCDTTSNYFNVWMDQLQPERYYRILIKTVDSNGTRIFDNRYIFKVIR